MSRSWLGLVLWTISMMVAVSAAGYLWAMDRTFPAVVFTVLSAAALWMVFVYRKRVRRGLAQHQ